MGNWTIRFLGRFTFSWRGMISRLRIQDIWLQWEKYYQVDCSLLIIHWFIIFWDTIWSKQVTNSQRFSDKYKSLHSLHQPTYPLIKTDQNRITVCSKLVEKRNIAQWKTASEMHVAPRIAVHCCTLLSIVVHYYPLLFVFTTPKFFCIHRLKCSKAISGWMDGWDEYGNLCKHLF